MKASVEKEMLKALVREAMIDLLEDDVYGCARPAPAGERGGAWAYVARAELPGAPIDRAEFVRLFD